MVWGIGCDSLGQGFEVHFMAEFPMLRALGA